MIKEVLKIYNKVFDGKTITDKDDFFSLGGDSIKAVILVTEFEKLFKLDIPMSEFYQHPVVQDFALYLQCRLKPASNIN